MSIGDLEIGKDLAHFGQAVLAVPFGIVKNGLFLANEAQGPKGSHFLIGKGLK